VIGDVAADHAPKVLSFLAGTAEVETRQNARLCNVPDRIA
jgi:hypothetical protein